MNTNAQIGNPLAAIPKTNRDNWEPLWKAVLSAPKGTPFIPVSGLDARERNTLYNVAKKGHGFVVRVRGGVVYIGKKGSKFS